MFALLWKIPREPFNQNTWTAEAEPGVHFHRIHDPTDSQEAKYIITEHSFMKNEWASSRSGVDNDVKGWRRFATTAYNHSNSQY
jgi:hypothetical protein